MELFYLIKKCNVFYLKYLEVKQICYSDKPKNLIALFENNTICIINEEVLNPIKIIEKGYIT